MNRLSLPSEGRRNPDLEWFYEYVTETAPSIALEKEGKDLWGTTACRAALTSDSVLYSICLVAALHHAHKRGALDLENDRIAIAYLGMALEEHRKDVSQLSVANIDNACHSSNMLRVFDLVKLQYRSLVPYTPPVAWMSMTSAMRGMFARAMTLTADEPNSMARHMIEAVEFMFREQDELTTLDELAHLLPQEVDPDLTDEALRAYRITINIVGGIWKACRKDRTSRELRIRLITFPIFLSDGFINLTSQRQPRALVILAHYFATLSAMRSYWYVGDAGSRELDAIAREVPVEWENLLREPLALRDEIVLSPKG